jgi:hypothetical protein
VAESTATHTVAEASDGEHGRRLLFGMASPLSTPGKKECAC